MNVSVAQTVEADTSCDTTITATITAVIGAPGAEIPEPATDTVTTTAADGSGSALFGVDLIITESDRSKDWNGEEELDYRIEVENTGQTNETINLAVSEGNGPGCGSASSFTRPSARPQSTWPKKSPKSSSPRLRFPKVPRPTSIAGK